MEHIKTHDCACFLDLQLAMQSEPITTDVSLNMNQGDVHNIIIYVIKFVSELRQVGGFLRFPPPIKLTPTNFSLWIENYIPFFFGKFE
jgi:hypothetical protein